MAEFFEFLVLLVVSVVVSGILHYGLKHYVRPGTWSFLSKIVVGWIGAWLGTPVLGNWFPGVAYGDIFIVPAIVGSVALLVLAIDVAQMLGANSQNESAA